MAVRRTGRPGHDRESLLTVAVHVFNERGYDGTSLQDLAAALGIGKSSIYHHVSGKSELLRMATDRALDALFAALAEPVPGSALDRVEHVVRRSVEVAVAELPYVTLLLRVRGNTDVEQRALARRRELDRALAELVTAAEAEGTVRSDVDPALTSRLIFGTVNSVVEWYRPDGRDTELADAVVRIVFDGLRSR